MTIRLLLHFIFFFLTAAAQIAVGGSFADENGNEQVVETTDSHPFWVINKDAWVEAKDLREGDVFIGANGELSCLSGKERVEYPAEITVYNFTVDGNHDYYVIAQTAEYGQTCILVHNAKDYGEIIPPQPQKKDIERVKDAYLKEHNIDPHPLKEACPGSPAEFDIYKDKNTGDLWGFLKGGRGEGTHLGNIRNVIN